MGPSPAVAPSAGLIGHWKLDETSGTSAADSAGSNNGTMQSGLDAGNDSIPGVDGTALEFDGTDDYISLGDPVALQLTGAMTVSTWVKISIGGNIEELVNRDKNTTDRGYRLVKEASDIACFGVAVDATTNANVCGSSAMPLGEWVLVTGVYKPSAFVRVYYNGTLAGENTTSIPASARLSTVGPRLGERGSGASPLHGSLDDVRIYNRALTADEITALYAMGRGYDVNKGLVAEWNLDEGSGSTSANKVPGGTDLSFSGGTAPAWTASGWTGSALSFDNTDDVATANTYDAIDLTSQLTLSAWVNLNSTAGTHDVFGKVITGTNFQYRMAVRNGNNLTFEFCDGVLAACNSGTNWNAQTTTGANIQAGQWYHLVATYDDAADNIVLYINGQPYADSVLNGAPETTPLVSSPNANILMGLSWAGEDTDGIIDDARIYNRALTADEVKQLYLFGLAHGPGCTSPAKPEGSLFYNTTSNVVQYCNGAKWIGIGK